MALVDGICGPKFYASQTGPFEDLWSTGGGPGSFLFDRFGNRWDRDFEVSDSNDWHFDELKVTEGNHKSLAVTHGPWTIESPEDPTPTKGEEMPSRSALKAQVEELERRLAVINQELADTKPQLPQAVGSVIRFTKFNYHWAAIKIERPTPLWYVTQDGTRSARQGIPPMTDEQFLVWVYERNWDSIEAMY